MADRGQETPAAPDPVVSKTLRRVSVIFLLSGATAGVALWLASIPAIFVAGVPAVFLVTAANLYRMSTWPKGVYSRKLVTGFDRTYRPLSPVKPLPDRIIAEAPSATAQADIERLRLEIDALKKRS